MPIAEINGIPIHYHVQGSGTPIVCIHPPFIASRIFNYQKYQLSETHRIITFDIRGHGHSGTSSQPLTYPILVEDMKQLLDFLGVDKAYVLGYSTGGQAALAALLTYPSKFLGGIVISGMSEVSDMITKSRMLAAGSAAKFRIKDAVAIPVAWGNADNRTTFENLHEDAKFGDPIKWKEYNNYAMSYNCTDRLHGIKVPMLLIYGEKDTTFHRYGHMLNDRLPNSRMYFIRDMKHQIPTKAADKVTTLIGEWIAQQEERDRADTFSEREAFDEELMKQGIVTEAHMART